MSKSSTAFTMTELVVVTVVVAIIAAISITSYRKAYTAAVDRTAQNAIDMIKIAVLVYYRNTGFIWPDQFRTLDHQQIEEHFNIQLDSSGPCTYSILGSNQVQVLISSMPKSGPPRSWARRLDLNQEDLCLGPFLESGTYKTKLCNAPCWNCPGHD